MTDQDREKRIAEIREALEKATPGPWTKCENRIFGKAQTAVDPIICEFFEEETERDRNNAHLIANAPEWLRFLLSELEREREEKRKLREERDEWGRTAQEAINTVFVREHQLQSAQQDKEKLIEGLRMATDLLGTVPMNDGRLWGAYNKLCDTLKSVGATME